MQTVRMNSPFKSKPPAGKLPFVYLNIAMTADGKLAPESRHFITFSSDRDRRHILELRAAADAVMSGARTVDLNPVKLDPGAKKYRELRLKRGLPEYNLRVIVSGSGTLDPDAEIFKHRFSPIIILTTGRAPQKNLARLQKNGALVKICGERKLDFAFALRWLWKEWGVKRLLCEGGGEINDALFNAGLVDELHLTLCPAILGGETAPTLADGEGFAHLADAARLKVTSRKQIGDELFLIYKVLK
jgi:2,5-diamino-6-(ribosylamino)-4(3H)-pyrimidinone 5'-phosphate reductase